MDAVNAKKKKLDNKGLEELKARIAKAPQEQQELDQINAALPVHKQNLVNAPKVTKILGDNRKEVEGMIKAADEAVAKASKAVSDQNDEITQFNTQQVIKKVKIVGKKNWVDAVLRVPENITKLGSPQVQGSLPEPAPGAGSRQRGGPKGPRQPEGRQGGLREGTQASEKGCEEIEPAVQISLFQKGAI